MVRRVGAARKQHLASLRILIEGGDAGLGKEAVVSLPCVQGGHHACVLKPAFARGKGHLNQGCRILGIRTPFDFGEKEQALIDSRTGW